jgi:predicted O-linked N-acetylglucosamine transferase (SPINDLY family)
VHPEFAAGRDALLQGRAADAARAFAAQVDREPGDFEARYWLASALLLLGEPDAADQALSDARTLHALAVAGARGADVARLRADADYAFAIGVQLYGQGQVAMASVAWGMAIAAGRADAQVFANYALSLQHQGRAEEASGVYRAVADQFDSPAMRQFLVYAQLFCQDGEARHFAEARAWAERYANVPPASPHANPQLSGRKLRIGYVAPNFAGSQLRQFVTPILEAHDSASVEVVLYPADAVTEAGWPDWIEVHPIGQLDDAAAAALIRQDRIDVLNDLWGHTAGSRLGVFARKPAPVQTAWINFFQTTGLPQVDYVMSAACDDPPDLSAQYVEQLWPLGPVFTPFRPAEGRLPPAPTPALATGQMTFGSFNHAAKLGAEAMDAWAEILRRAPDARLWLKYRYFADPIMQRQTQAEFAARGVAPERIVFAGHTAGEDYFRAFQQVDVMLDCWPAPGSTTTLEALSNGVPVLAMVGDPPNLGGFYARTILRAAGLPELATTTPRAFVETALALAEDPSALDALRARVRPGFDGGPLCDEAGFARGLEAAFAQMFERWQASWRPPHALSAEKVA